MLRISVLSTALGMFLKLEGKLSGPGVDELEICCNILRQTAASRSLCVDLTEVRCISPAGRTLLESISRSGIVVVESNPNRASSSMLCDPCAVVVSGQNRESDNAIGSRASISHVV